MYNFHINKKYITTEKHQILQSQHKSRMCQFILSRYLELLLTKLQLWYHKMFLKSYLNVL